MQIIIPVLGYGAIHLDPQTRIGEVYLYGAYAGRARYARSGTWIEIEKAAGLRRREVLLSALLAALPDARAALIDQVRVRAGESPSRYRASEDIPHERS